MHDLVLGSINFLDSPFTKLSYVEGYYPLYLYRGKYYMIPDFSSTGSPPLTRKHPKQFRDNNTTNPINQLLINDEVPSSHLSSRYTRGWVNLTHTIDPDIPYFSKTTVASFDIHILEKAKFDRTANDNLMKIQYYDALDKLACTVDIRYQIGLNTDNEGVYEGNLDFEMKILIGLQPEITMQLSLTLIKEFPQNSLDYLNHGDFIFNDYETKIKLIGLVSKKTITVVVRYYFCWMHDWQSSRSL